MAIPNQLSQFLKNTLKVDDHSMKRRFYRNQTLMQLSITDFNYNIYSGLTEINISFGCLKCKQNISSSFQLVQALRMTFVAK